MNIHPPPLVSVLAPAVIVYVLSVGCGAVAKTKKQRQIADS